jgi:PadR family transcriptional regulator, regulatory protein PadR
MRKSIESANFKDASLVPKESSPGRHEPRRVAASRYCPHPLMAVDGVSPLAIQSHHELMGLTNTPSDLLPGTLELLILKTLVSGAKHGYGIVEHLRLASDDVLRVGESALYPALQRLLLNGWVKAEWGTSENNRRARYYTLTAAGRKQLAAERAEFDRMVGAIQQVLATS